MAGHGLRRRSPAACVGLRHSECPVRSGVQRAAARGAAADRRRQRRLQHRQSDVRAGITRHGGRPCVAAAALARARQAFPSGVAHRRSSGRPHAAADARGGRAGSRARRQTLGTRSRRFVRRSQLCTISASRAASSDRFSPSSTTTGTRSFRRRASSCCATR